MDGQSSVETVLNCPGLGVQQVIQMTVSAWPAYFSSLVSHHLPTRPFCCSHTDVPSGALTCRSLTSPDPCMCTASHFPQAPSSAWWSPTRLSPEMTEIVSAHTSKDSREITHIASSEKSLVCCKRPTHVSCSHCSFPGSIPVSPLAGTARESLPSREVPVLDVLTAHCSCPHDHNNDPRGLAFTDCCVQAPP